MIICKWSAICFRFIVDRQTGLCSLIDVIDRINVPYQAELLPAPPLPPLSVVSTWLDLAPVGDAEPVLEIVVKDPNGVTIHAAEYPVPNWAESTAQVVVSIAGVSAAVPGHHQISQRMRGAAGQDWGQPVEITYEVVHGAIALPET